MPLSTDAALGLERPVRAHTDFIEVTPIFLVSLLICELVVSYLWWGAIIRSGFIVGRILHAESLMMT